ncbi:hypothetical protein [Burkholderia cepacia]|uniref:hypothetical protein n=1 Tax=Burkholderia cepacia TaxID=292 RepID=UPI0012D9D7FD|nr:hypothetical protein [Burkholderia cepacia]
MDLDTGEVRLYPFWLTTTEAGHTPELIQFEGGRKLLHTRRERIGEPAWREAYKVKPSGIRPLPDFDSPAYSDLVELYRRERDPEVRRVILEIVRVRRVMAQIAELTAIIRSEYGDELVALFTLRTLLREEQQRTGEIDLKS